MTTETTSPTGAPAHGRTPDLRVVPIGNVHPHPRNIRRELRDVDELTASIRAAGVRSPLEVAPAATLPGLPAFDHPGDHFVIVAGHRRYEAASRAGLDVVPVIVVADIRTDADVTLEMLRENLQRADITPIEEAAAYAQLELAGMKPTEIAKRTGRSRTTVAQRLALMDLPESAREKVHARQITLEEAAALVEFANDPANLDRLEKAAGTNAFAWELQSAKNRREQADRIAKQQAALAAAGTRVVSVAELTNGRGWWGSFQLERVLPASAVPGITSQTSTEQDDELRRAAHESCPHHAALIGGTGEVFYVCTEPAVHRTSSAAAGGVGAEEDGDTTEEDDEQRRAHEAAAEQRRRDQEDVATAAALRREFVVSVITGRRGLLSAGSAAAIGLCASEYILDLVAEPTAHDIAPWLGLTLDPAPDGTDWHARDVHDEAQQQRVRGEMARRGGTLALLAVTAAMHDDMLGQPYHWRPTADELRPGNAPRRWLALLEDLGYELSPWEAARLAAADAHALDQAAEQAADEHDDEDGDA